MTAPRPRVALIVETSIDYGRGVLRGVADYLHRHDPWSIWVEQREIGAPPPAWLRDWEGDGIITRSDDRRILKLGLPTVGLFMPKKPIDIPVIHLDNHAIGRLAAEHLMDRGLKAFAFFGERGSPWSEARLEGFTATLATHGHTVDAWQLSVTDRRQRADTRLRRDLLAWMTSMPTPLGLFAANDLHGFKALDACRQGNLPVPEQVAVISADNDADLCALADPPLSSVTINPERAGYEAASMLDRMMRGRRVSRQPLLISPLPVVARRSTDVLAVDDPHVAAALRLIRTGAAEGLTVEQLVRQLPLSRRSLEHRFRQALGRTPKAEIDRLRLERLERLLAETTLPITDIADRTGFHQPAYLCAFFRKHRHMTPESFRKLHRTDRRGS